MIDGHRRALVLQQKKRNQDEYNYLPMGFICTLIELYHEAFINTPFPQRGIFLLLYSLEANHLQHGKHDQWKSNLKKID
jgi:hypothetical protein